MKQSRYLLVALLAMFLAGCQEQAQPEKPQAEASGQQEPKAQEDSEEASKETGEDMAAILAEKEMLPLPADEKDLIAQPSGKINDIYVVNAEERQQVEEAFLKEFGEVPPLPEDASEEQLDLYFNYIYSLVAYDFQDPQDVLDQMEFALSGTPEADPRFAFKENYNVEIILDSSGSMANLIEGETRMELAKKAIREFMTQVPEEANVSLRVYGHEGDGTEAQKAASCETIDEVYKRGAFDEAKFNQALDAFEPAGWTPVAGALESAKESFAGLDAKTNTNLVYLVSDGIETCGGDPVAVAKTFSESDVSPIINVIGFNADSETQQQLKEVAAAANGIFSNVNSGTELTEEFEQSQEVLARWEAWKVDSEVDVLAASNASWLAITKFENRWHASTDQQHLGLIRVFGLLQEKGYLTFNQVDALTARAAEIEQLAKESRETLVTELNRVKEQGLEKMRSEIDKKYPEKTDQQ